MNDLKLGLYLNQFPPFIHITTISQLSNTNALSSPVCFSSFLSFCHTAFHVPPDVLSSVWHIIYFGTKMSKSTVFT